MLPGMTRPRHAHAVDPALKENALTRLKRIEGQVRGVHRMVDEERYCADTLVQISAVANAGYDLQRLEAERKGWLARNEQLELELAKRRSLAWVESQAVQRLGMVRAEKPVYVQVDSGHEQEPAASNGVARPATRGDSVESPSAPRAGRPEPGNPAWALETIQSWLAVLASR